MESGGAGGNVHQTLAGFEKSERNVALMAIGVFILTEPQQHAMHSWTAIVIQKCMRLCHGPLGNA